MAPKTDCAGVRIPSAIIKLTPKTDTSLSKRWTALLRSRKERMLRVLVRRSLLLCLFISTVFLALGSCWEILHYTVLAFSLSGYTMGSTYITTQQTVKRKGTSLAFIIGKEHDTDIFDRNDQCQCPDDERQGSQEIIIRWLRGECGREDIERTCPNITVDDTSGLVCKPESISNNFFYFLRYMYYHSIVHPLKVCDTN
jgi:hypothetical protein